MQECNSRAGITVGLIDAIMTSSKIAHERVAAIPSDSLDDSIVAALSDLFDCQSMRFLLQHGGNMAFEREHERLDTQINLLTGQVELLTAEVAAEKEKTSEAWREFRDLSVRAGENYHNLLMRFRSIQARAEAAEAHAADMQAALEAQRSLPIARSKTPSGRKHEDEVEELVERVLKATPAQSLAALKAAELEKEAGNG